MGFALSDMQVKSSAFEAHAAIPTKYTGEGPDVSPELSWSGAPDGTKAFAVICHDPDAPLVKGGDYGWHPVPGYDESVPMTDQSLPGKQREARWSSGDPTVAPGGASFVVGKKWGALRGTLAVAVLKDQRVLFMKFDDRGRLKRVRTPDALREHGRIRQVVDGPGHDLLVLTDSAGNTGVGRRSTMVSSARRYRAGATCGAKSAG